MASNPSDSDSDDMEKHELSNTGFSEVSEGPFAGASQPQQPQQSQQALAGQQQLPFQNGASSTGLFQPKPDEPLPGSNPSGITVQQLQQQLMTIPMWSTQQEREMFFTAYNTFLHGEDGRIEFTHEQLIERIEHFKNELAEKKAKLRSWPQESSQQAIQALRGTAQREILLARVCIQLLRTGVMPSIGKAAVGLNWDLGVTHPLVPNLPLIAQEFQLLHQHQQAQEQQTLQGLCEQLETLQGLGGQLETLQGPPGIVVPPMMLREQFFKALQDTWQQNSVQPNANSLKIGNHQIDLYQLHTEVLQYGGVANVNRHSLWNMITSKLDIQAEPGFSSEQIADHFKAVYQEFLEPFETQYMTAMMRSSMGIGTSPDSTNTPQQPNVSVQPPNTGVQQQQHQKQQQQQQLPVQQPTIPVLPPMIHIGSSSIKTDVLVRLLDMTVEQIRAVGFSEILAQTIDSKRNYLKDQVRAAVQQRTLLIPRVSTQQLQQQQQAGPQGPQPGQPGPSNLMTNTSQMISYLQNVTKPTQESVAGADRDVEQFREEHARKRAMSAQPDIYRQYTEMEKVQFKTKFESVIKCLLEMDRYLGMFLAATKDVGFVRAVVDMIDFTHRQRVLLVQPDPAFIIDLTTLEQLTKLSYDARAKVLIVLHQLQILTRRDQQQQMQAQAQAQQPLPL